MAVTVILRLIPHPANETGVLPNGGKGGWFLEDIEWGGRVYVGSPDDLTKLRNLVYGPGPKAADNALEPGQIYAQEIDVINARYIAPLRDNALRREAEARARIAKETN